MSALNACLGLWKNIPRQLKKIRTKNSFSSWRKLIFKFSKFSKFPKWKFREKNLKIEISIEMSFNIDFSKIDVKWHFNWNFDFSDFLSKCWFSKIWNFWNFEINFLQDEKIFFFWMCFYCLVIFFRNPKHAFIAPMIPSERCYSA